MRSIQSGLREGACICLTSLLALSLQGCGQGNAQEQLRAARSNLDKGQTAAAAIQLRGLLKEHPAMGEAAFSLGLANAAQGDLATASEAFRLARANGVSAEQVVPEWADALFKMGRTEELLQRFGGMELQDSGRAAALLRLISLAQARSGNLPAALATANSALKKLPDDPASLLAKARVVAVMGDVAAARETVKAILEKHADNALAWELGAELRQGDSQAAITDYRKALSLQPSLGSAHASLIALLIAQPDLRAAGAQQQVMLKQLPRDINALYFGGLIALLGGDAPQAQKTAARLLQMAPSNPQVLLLASMTAARLGDGPAALGWSEQAASAAPLSRDQQIHLAHSYVAYGQSDKALATLKATLSRLPDDVQVMVAQAEVMQARGDWRESDRLYAKALGIDPGNEKIRIAFADTLLRRGQTDAGIRELQQASAAAPAGEGALALALAQFDRGNLEAAAAALYSLPGKQAEKPAALLLRSRLLLGKGDAAGSRKVLEALLAQDAEHEIAAARLAELDLGDGEFEKARHRLDMVLALQPTPPSALLAQAKLVRLAGGSNEEITALLDRATRLNPKDAATWVSAIDSQLAGGAPGLALAMKLNQAALKELPESAELMLRMASVQSASGRAEVGVAAIAQALSRKPDSLPLRLALAQAQLAAGQPEQAFETVKPALARDPQNISVQHMAFEVAMGQGQGGAAAAIAKTLQLRVPDDALGFRLEGQAQSALKNWPAAAEAYRKGLDKQHGDGMAARLHAALIEGRQDAQARQFETSWLQTHADDANFLKRLGEAALMRQDWATAEARFRQVLARQPAHAAALNNLALTLTAQKKAGAIALAERATRLDGQNPQFKDTMAAAYAQGGQLDLALAQQARAVELAPQASPMRLNLARLLLQSGQPEKARLALANLSAAEISQAGLQTLLSSQAR